MQKKISIIVPVYNGEKYLSRCIDSILSQRFDMESVEVLLLNDGSKDGSLKLIRTYEKRNKGIIKVIDQKNIGAARTRNKGIKLATGEYVTLIDQDDYIDEDYLTTFYDAITIGKSEVVQGGFKLVDSTGATRRIIFPKTSVFGRFLAIPAWAKIYRIDFIRQNNITFFENNIGEDSIFTTNVILATKRYHTIEYAGYNNYFDNMQNVTNSLHKKMDRSVSFIPLLDKLLTLKSSNKEMQTILSYNIIRTAVYYLLSYGRYATPARFYEVQKEVFYWLRENLSFRNKLIWLKQRDEYTNAYLGILLMILLDRVKLVPLFAKLYCKGKGK